MRYVCESLKALTYNHCKKYHQYRKGSTKQTRAKKPLLELKIISLRAYLAPTDILTRGTIMTSTRNILFHVFISSFGVGPLYGMEVPSQKLTVETCKEYINMPYLIAKIGALALNEGDSSEEKEGDEIELEHSLIQREVVTIFIDSLRLGTMPLTINSKNLILKEICNPSALSKLLHMLHRDYHDPHTPHTFAHYVALLNKSIHWESLKKVLDAHTYDSLSTLMKKTETSKLEAEGYRFFFETVAKAVEFPFDTEIHSDALNELCKELALKKTPAFETILACFRPQKAQDLLEETPKRNRTIRSCIGLICCINDYFKDKSATCEKLLRLYASAGQRTLNHTS